MKILHSLTARETSKVILKHQTRQIKISTKEIALIATIAQVKMMHQSHRTKLIGLTKDLC